ncbi:MAG: hypothetical protein P8182_20410, partial [Deltaproteobacteria bacterium]
MTGAALFLWTAERNTGSRAQTYSEREYCPEPLVKRVSAERELPPERAECLQILCRLNGLFGQRLG